MTEAEPGLGADPKLAVQTIVVPPHPADNVSEEMSLLAGVTVRGAVPVNTKVTGVSVVFTCVLWKHRI